MAMSRLTPRLHAMTGADVDAMDFKGSTALCETALHGRVDVARLLLDKGTSPCTGGMPPQS
jgi:ankyrin repeat protein